MKRTRWTWRVEGVLLATLSEHFQHDPPTSILLVIQVHLVLFTHLRHITSSCSSELLLLLLHRLFPLLVPRHVLLVDLLLRPLERNMLQQASEQEEALRWLFRHRHCLRHTIYNSGDLEVLKLRHLFPLIFPALHQSQESPTISCTCSN